MPLLFKAKRVHPLPLEASDTSTITECTTLAPVPSSQLSQRWMRRYGRSCPYAQPPEPRGFSDTVRQLMTASHASEARGDPRSHRRWRLNSRESRRPPSQSQSIVKSTTTPGTSSRPARRTRVCRPQSQSRGHRQGYGRGRVAAASTASPGASAADTAFGNVYTDDLRTEEGGAIAGGSDRAERRSESQALTQARPRSPVLEARSNARSPSPAPRRTNVNRFSFLSPRALSSSRSTARSTQPSLLPHDATQPQMPFRRPEATPPPTSTPAARSCATVLNAGETEPVHAPDAEPEPDRGPTIDAGCTSSVAMLPNAAPSPVTETIAEVMRSPTVVSEAAPAPAAETPVSPLAPVSASSPALSPALSSAPSLAPALKAAVPAGADDMARRMLRCRIPHTAVCQRLAMNFGIAMDDATAIVDRAAGAIGEADDEGGQGRGMRNLLDTPAASVNKGENKGEDGGGDCGNDDVSYNSGGSMTFAVQHSALAASLQSRQREIEAAALEQRNSAQAIQARREADAAAQQTADDAARSAWHDGTRALLAAEGDVKQLYAKEDHAHDLLRCEIHRSLAPTTAGWPSSAHAEQARRHGKLVATGPGFLGTGRFADVIEAKVTGAAGTIVDTGAAVSHIAVKRFRYRPLVAQNGDTASVPPAACTKAFHAELRALRRVPPHKNIVRLVGAFVRPHLLLAFELVQVGSLHAALKRFSLWDNVSGPARAHVGQGLASALQHMHAHDVCHGDVKSHNVLLRRDAAGCLEAVLCDLGSCDTANRSVGSDKSSGVAGGTAGYAAPEILEADSAATPSSAADVWALGVVLWELMRDLCAQGKGLGCAPVQNQFAGLSPSLALKRLRAGDRLPLPQSAADPTAAGRVVPVAFNSTLNDCWSFIPANRPTAAAVADSMQLCASGDDNQWWGTQPLTTTRDMDLR